MKSILKALRSGSSSKASRDGGAAATDENASPLVPRRLLSLTPAGTRPDSRILDTKGDATVRTNACS